MTKNKLLAIIPHRAVYAILPLLLAGCKSDKPNADAELADIEVRLTTIDTKLNDMQQETQAMLIDSVARDAQSIEIKKEIDRHGAALKKLKAPKDTTMQKRLSRKLGKIRMDSVMRANALKEQIINMRKDQFRAIYKEQDSLRARQAELMRIKKR